MKSFPLTIFLIAFCVLVAIISQLGEATHMLAGFWIIDIQGENPSALAQLQIWRLITPIFIHFGFMHLLFNMLCLKDLGDVIEQKKGNNFFGFFIIIVAAISNLAQFYLTGSPFFGGMSGVVYGLLGYLWMQGKYNPFFGYSLSDGTVLTMLIWFVLCWIGLLGPIANWAHTAGLAVGMVWGWGESRLRRRKLH